MYKIGFFILSIVFIDSTLLYKTVDYLFLIT
jgi:hypothetical protein